MIASYSYSMSRLFKIYQTTSLFFIQHIGWHLLWMGYKVNKKTKQSKKIRTIVYYYESFRHTECPSVCQYDRVITHNGNNSKWVWRQNSNELKSPELPNQMHPSSIVLLQNSSSICWEQTNFVISAPKTFVWFNNLETNVGATRNKGLRLIEKLGNEN